MTTQKIYDLQDRISDLEDIVSDLLDDDKMEEANEYIVDLEKLRKKLMIEESKHRREKTFLDF